MRRWWGWLIAIALVALGACLWFWHRSHGRTTDAALAASKMVEAWHGQAIAVKQAQITVLKQDAETNDSKIEVLKAKIKEHKKVIEQSYESSGMSAEEIAQRFRNLSR